MTNDGIEVVITTLSGEYPNEAWKLAGSTGLAFSAALRKRFKETKDDDVLDALDAAIAESPKALPSVSAIALSLKHIKNRVPDFKAVPEMEVNPTGIKRVKETIALYKDKDRQLPQGPHWPRSASEREVKEITRFAKFNFPDIALTTIMEDFEVFREQYRTRGYLDGHKTVLRINKYTGEVYRAVVMNIVDEKKR